MQEVQAMPRITIEQFPTVSKSGRVSKYAEQMAELEELLAETAVVTDEDGNAVLDDDGNEVTEPTYGIGEGLVFEISKNDLSALVSSLRKVGHDAGRKVKTVFSEGSVYVTDGGAIES